MTADSNKQNAMPELEHLWKAQHVASVNSDRVIELAKSQRLKQRLYILLDLLSLLPLLWLFTIVDELSVFLKWFVAINCVAVLAMVFYFTRLRWLTAFNQRDTTENYTQRLIKQFNNNAKIAKVNKHSAWMSLLVAVLGISISYYLNPDDVVINLPKFSLMLLAAGAFLAGWTIWAHKRQRRFEDEAKELQKLIQ
jgi:hypothetical protein